MNQLRLKRHAGRRLGSGHLWVFSNELDSLPDFPPGKLVEVIDSRGQSYGTGFYNPNSLISVRLLFTDEKIDIDFFAGRINKANLHRNVFFPDEQCYRVVFGESDFLPGLIVDKYDDYLAVQYLSAGIEIRKDTVIEALLKVFPNTIGIIEKNQSRLRAIEGLESYDNTAYGTIPDEINISEYDIKLSISLLAGQKTGYYLDQKLNRKYIRIISRGKNVLDCFCNQGGFALNAAKAGAGNVLGIDSSEEVLHRARANAGLNGFDAIDFAKADVFDFLEKEISNGSEWDVVVLDPPAFAKNKKSVPTALAGYRRLNKLALQIIPTGGYLATSSCSQHILEDRFAGEVQSAASRTGRQLRLIHRGTQPPDHPILSSMPETAYLKFFVYQVI